MVRNHNKKGSCSKNGDRTIIKWCLRDNLQVRQLFLIRHKNWASIQGTFVNNRRKFGMDAAINFASQISNRILINFKHFRLESFGQKSEGKKWDELK
jgi:hypothetical protein